VTERIELPAAYTLHALDSVDSVMDEAWRLIAAGAGEGALVWARSQTAGRTQRGRPWPSPPGNLYLGLVLRPDTAAERDPALALLALCACGSALGEIAPPMTDLKYRWPDRVIVNGAACAGVVLEDAGPGQAGDALVLGAFVNVHSHAPDQQAAASSLAAEGFQDMRVEDVLTGFCRHFARWAGLWSEQGIGPAVRQIEGRLDSTERSVTATAGAGTVRGEVVGLDQTGAARVNAGGAELRLTLTEYFGLAPANAGPGQ
jgi:BirA family biotin operon repressor/biotin-[acetyl-CoA-carboxylase] ligase